MASELPPEVIQVLYILGFVSLGFELYRKVRNKR